LSWVSLLRPYLTRFCPSGQDKTTKKPTPSNFLHANFCLLDCLFVVEHIVDMPQCRPNTTMQ
jgi:hypothetical protein